MRPGADSASCAQRSLCSVQVCYIQPLTGADHASTGALGSAYCNYRIASSHYLPVDHDAARNSRTSARERCVATQPCSRQSWREAERLRLLGCDLRHATRRPGSQRSACCSMQHLLMILHPGRPLLYFGAASRQPRIIIEAHIRTDLLSYGPKIENQSPPDVAAEMSPSHTATRRLGASSGTDHCGVPQLRSASFLVSGTGWLRLSDHCGGSQFESRLCVSHRGRANAMPVHRHVCKPMHPIWSSPHHA